MWLVVLLLVAQESKLWNNWYKSQPVWSEKHHFYGRIDPFERPHPAIYLLSYLLTYLPLLYWRQWYAAKDAKREAKKRRKNTYSHTLRLRVH